ncbi:MAG: tRNA pseudouridine synthase A [Bacteroidales bacterium]|nr:tRNA pseudouridine synthase A [Tenuifilaceae bacterium]
MRYFVHCGYNGYNYRGWQRQPKVITIQEVFEQSFLAVFKTPINCIGCGRTDAMVHAAQYFFHFDYYEELPTDLMFKLNKVLPVDIAIFEIIPVDGYPSAQLSATLRTYKYFIHTYKDPFLSAQSSYYPLPNLNIDKMQQAAALLLKYDDYTAFCRSPLKVENSICKITVAQLLVNPKGDKLQFQISSKHFLRSMVRLIVKRLIDIGTGELSMDEFESYLAETTKPLKDKPAYPQGLYLSKIVYPFLDIPQRPDFNAVF